MRVSTTEHWDIDGTLHWAIDGSWSERILPPAAPDETKVFAIGTLSTRSDVPSSSKLPRFAALFDRLRCPVQPLNVQRWRTGTQSSCEVPGGETCRGPRALQVKEVSR